MAKKTELKEASGKLLEALTQKRQEAQKAAKEARESAIYFQRASDEVEWQHHSFETIPSEADEVLNENRRAEDLLQYYHNFSSGLLNMPCYYGARGPESVVGVAASGSSGTETIISDVQEELESLTFNSWAFSNTALYNDKIQERQQKIQYIKSQLRYFEPIRVMEFERAIEAFEAYEAGVGEMTAAAIAMRNVLEHIKGDILEKAISRPPEQKIEWSQMAQRLAKGGTSGIEFQTLVGEEQNWKIIKADLTQYAKNLQPRKFDFATLYMLFINHLFTIFSSIDSQQL